MFTANNYVDVWRDIAFDQNYSEYDSSEASQKTLVATKVPIHITPFKPDYSGSSRGEGQQSTRIIANTRRNHTLRGGDELRTADGRVFEVLTVEPTDGAFMGNSIIYQLIENNPVV